MDYLYLIPLILMIKIAGFPDLNYILKPMLFESELIISETSFTWGKEQKSLIIRLNYSDDSLLIQIKNIDNAPIKVCSHINDFDLDLFEIILTDQSGIIRKIAVGSESRTGSRMNTCLLKRGESFSHKVDLKYWAMQNMNGGLKLKDGIYNIKVIYRAKDCYYPSKEYWNGILESTLYSIEIK